MRLVPHRKESTHMKFKKTTCPDCDQGKSYCEAMPCWPTPNEAEKIIAAGLGRRLMNDYWVGDDMFPETHLVGPAIRGIEGYIAPYFKAGPCTFLTKDKKCELHDKGLKPLEGRTACCQTDSTSDAVRRHIVKLWNEPKGKVVLTGWRHICKETSSQRGNLPDYERLNTNRRYL